LEMNGISNSANDVTKTISTDGNSFETNTDNGIFGNANGGSLLSSRSVNVEGPEYKKYPIIMKSQGCTNNGRYLECNVRIITEVSSTEVNLYKSQCVIIDQNDGQEFMPIDIIFGDKSCGQRSSVAKNLVKNIPVNITLRYEPNKNISVVGRLNMRYYDSHVRDWITGDLN